MVGPRRDMRAVELADDDELGALDEHEDEREREHEHEHGPAPDGATARGTRRRRTATALAATALVLLLAAAGVVQDRRESARLGGLAGLPGIVAPLPGPVTERWRERGWTGSDLREVGGRLVGAVSTPYRSVDVVALDPRTGAAVWRTPVAPAAVRDLWTQCVVPGAPAPEPVPGRRPAVVCVAVDETTTSEQSSRGSVTYPSSARLVRVDALDGALLGDEPAPPTSQVAVLGADAVLAHVRPDGRARLARLDPRTGHERWSFVTPEPVPVDAFGLRGVTVQAAGDVVALQGARTWLLTGDGEVLNAWRPERPPSLGPSLELLAGGRLAARPVAVPGGGWGTELVDVATGGAWTASGSPVPVRPDDGSLPDVVLLRRDGTSVVVAHDRGTGAPRWTLALSSSVQVAVLDGRVVAVDADAVRAVDGRTGAELWTRRVDHPVQGGLVSDGRVVLVSGPGRTAGGVVTALGIEDGRPRWTTEVEHALFLFAVDGHLYGWSARGLQALGPPAPPAP